MLRGGLGPLSGADAPIGIVECSSLPAVHDGRASAIYVFLDSMNEYRVYRLKKGKSVPSRLVPVESEQALPYQDNLFCFLSGHLESLAPELFARV